MDVDSLSSFLQDKGFPLEYCEALEGWFVHVVACITMQHNTDNYVDDEALFQLTDKDIREMVPVSQKIFYT